MANGVIGVVSLLVLRAVGQARNIEQGNVIILLHLMEEKIASDYPSILPIVILSLVKVSSDSYCYVKVKIFSKFIISIFHSFFIKLFFKVNGNWSNWKKYSACSKSCGSGLKSRKRTCTNPAPSNGGSKCKGSAKETMKCNTQSCKKKSKFYRYVNWTKFSSFIYGILFSNWN